MSSINPNGINVGSGIRFRPAVAAAFLPSDIAGLQLWVKSDTGVTDAGGGACSSWADQSGNSRDLTEGTNRPSIQSAQVNGYPGIRFDGSNDKLTSPSFTLNQPFTVFAIVKVITNTNPRRIFGSTGGTVTKPVLRGGSTVQLNDESSGADGASVSMTSGTYYLLKVVGNSTSSVMALNNGSDATSASDINDPLTSAAGFQLGCNAGASFANVEYAEIAIYDSSITGTNLTNLLTYFQTRYALW